jgi:prophage regulatory protein
MTTEAKQELLRWPAVHSMTGVALQTAYRWMANGKFPRPIKIGEAGPRSMSFWLKSEIEEFIAKRIQERGDAYQHGPLEAPALGARRGRPRKARPEEAAA